MTPRLCEAIPAEHLGWALVEGVRTPDGRTIFRTTRSQPVLYATSRHGWDLELITREQLEEIVAHAMMNRHLTTDQYDQNRAAPPIEERLAEALRCLDQLLTMEGGR